MSLLLLLLLFASTFPLVSFTYQQLLCLRCHIQQSLQWFVVYVYVCVWWVNRLRGKRKVHTIHAFCRESAHSVAIERFNFFGKTSVLFSLRVCAYIENSELMIQIEIQINLYKHILYLFLVIRCCEELILRRLFRKMLLELCSTSDSLTFLNT